MHEQVARQGEGGEVGLEPGCEPARGAGVEGDVVAAVGVVASESGRDRFGRWGVQRDGVDEVESVNQRKVGTLAELRAHGVRGVSQQRDAVVVNAVANRVVVRCEDELIHAAQMNQQRGGMRIEFDDAAFKLSEACGTQRFDLVGAEAPKDADGWFGVGGGFAAGEVADHAARVAIGLAQG